MEDKKLDRQLEREHQMGDRIAAKAKRAMQHIENNPIRWPSSGPFFKRAKASISRPGVYNRSRPVSKQGAQSFHFSFTSVSRGLDGTRTAGRRGGESAAHAMYIEREGAAEILKSKSKENEKDRDRDKDLKDPSIMQDYIEREGAAETLETPETGDHILASFGNIHESYEERINFWKKLEQSERAPQKHYLLLNRDVQKGFWEILDKDPDAPKLLKNLDPQKTQVAGDEKSIREAMKYLEAKRAIGERKAVRFKPGRGGRVQYRIIVELPYELDPKNRLALAKKFCGLIEEKNLPYWAVIHAPDHHNDRRNYHMHIAFAERPAKQMIDPTDGKKKWDFEIIETFRSASRNERQRRPFMQSKDRDINDQKIIKTWRGKFAKFANETMKASGIKKKLDPRRYTEMGIDLNPVPRLSPKQYQQEKKGAAKPENSVKILEQWQREIARLDQRIGGAKTERAKKLKGFEERFDKAILKSDPIGKSALERAKNMFLVAEDQKINALANIEATRHVMARIESRTVPPLEKNKTLKDETMDMSRTWAAMDIEEEKQKIIKSDARSRAALTFLKASEFNQAHTTRNDLMEDLKKSINNKIQREVEMERPEFIRIDPNIDYSDKTANQTAKMPEQTPAPQKSADVNKLNVNDNKTIPDVNQKAENVNQPKAKLKVAEETPGLTKTPRIRYSKPRVGHDKATIIVETKEDLKITTKPDAVVKKTEKPQEKIIPIQNTESVPPKNKEKIKAVIEELGKPTPKTIGKPIEKTIAKTEIQPGKTKLPIEAKPADQKTEKQTIIAKEEMLGQKPKPRKKSKKEREEELRKRAMIAQRSKRGR